MTDSWHIRGADPKLCSKAKAQAALEGKKPGDWFNDAIKFYLEKVKKETR